jgi:hypothetical protein
MSEGGSHSPTPRQRVDVTDAGSPDVQRDLCLRIDDDSLLGKGGGPSRRARPFSRITVPILPELPT